MVWKPDVTVAAVVERDGRFLLVEEHTERGLLLNQPAGHLEAGESIVAAVVRETLEETAWEFAPEHLIGVYRWRPSGSDFTYLRFAFSGHLGTHHADRALDSWTPGSCAPCGSAPTRFAPAASAIAAHWSCDAWKTTWRGYAHRSTCWWTTTDTESKLEQTAADCRGYVGWGGFLGRRLAAQGAGV